LYTGDFNTQKTYCGQAKPRKCDTLIMEGTFGNPHYIFPPRDLVVEDLLKYLDEHPRSVIKAYSFGKSQEMCHILNKHKVSFKVESPQAKAINDALGLKFRYERDDASILLGSVVPKGYRSIAVSGWAVDPHYKYQAGVDAAFPLSDHSDFPSLLEFARSCDPKRIRIFHGGAHVHLASSLRKLGYDAEPFPVEQKKISQFS
jgi:Cft2 family RNA processing exonuclease